MCVFALECSPREVPTTTGAPMILLRREYVVTGHSSALIMWGSLLNDKTLPKTGVNPGPICRVTDVPRCLEALHKAVHIATGPGHRDSGLPPVAGCWKRISDIPPSNLGTSHAVLRDPASSQNHRVQRILVVVGRCLLQPALASILRLFSPGPIARMSFFRNQDFFYFFFPCRWGPWQVDVLDTFASLFSSDACYPVLSWELAMSMPSTKASPQCVMMVPGAFFVGAVVSGRYVGVNANQCQPIGFL